MYIQTHQYKNLFPSHANANTFDLKYNLKSSGDLTKETQEKALLKALTRFLTVNFKSKITTTTRHGLVKTLAAPLFSLRRWWLDHYSNEEIKLITNLLTSLVVIHNEFPYLKIYTYYFYTLSRETQHLK